MFKSEVELSGQQKVMEGTVTGETVIEGPLVERSANEKTVLEGTVNKKWEVEELTVK